MNTINIADLKYWVRVYYDFAKEQVDEMSEDRIINLYREIPR
jgi:hypothetical protein